MFFFRFLLLVAMMVAMTVPADASTAVQWVVCDNCSATARQQTALQLPPNQFQSTDVHVLDSRRGELSAYRVNVFYDYEFQQFFRFAIAQAPTDAALAEFSAWQSYQAETQQLQSSEKPVALASAADWIRHNESAGSAGLLDLNGLYAAIERMPGLRFFINVPHIRLRFHDRSGGIVAVAVNPVNGQLSTPVVAGSLRGPNGQSLPDDVRRLHLMDQVGDDSDTTYLAQHLQTAWDNVQWLHRLRSLQGQWRTLCDQMPGGSVTCYATDAG
ncbi:MAG: hypothetical protein AAGJ86_10515 [Pseudomonadota bacterium]